MLQENVYQATGKRKTAIARTILKPGAGEIIINNRPIDDYFKVEPAKTLLKQPLDYQSAYSFRPRSETVVKESWLCQT